MKKTVQGLLTGSPALVAIVPAARWFRAGNVVDVPVRPFVVLRWLSPVRLGSGRDARQLRIDVHDERGSYTKIQALIGSRDLGTGVYGVLAPLTDYVGSDGRITQCDFLGTGGDLEDDVYKTNYSYSSWQLIGVDL
jgi:hypothetical protein